MKDILTAVEMEVCTEMVKAGLEHSADAFSRITGKEVKVQSHQIDIFTCEHPLTIDGGSEDQLKVLLTDILGDFGGRSVLIFNNEEEEVIYNSCLKYDKIAEEEKTIMEDEILKEIDNMLSAAVVTVFADQLDAMIFGGVPHLKKLTVENTNDLISNDLRNLSSGEESFILGSKTKFLIDDKETFVPRFLWMFSREFLDAVKSKNNANVM